jgi:AcrR family transcriptional regulator
VDSETNRIAAVAAARFHEFGITATGVDELRRAAGVSKRTLYERFGSKDGLIVAAYESLDLPVYQMFTARIEAESDDPRAQLDAFFAQLEPILGSSDFRGCPFTNAAAELPDPDHPAHKVVRRHKERLRRWLRDRARAAGASDPETLSRELMIVFQGAQSQALIQHSGRPARDARVMASALIGGQITPAPASTRRPSRSERRRSTPDR